MLSSTGTEGLSTYELYGRRVRSNVSLGTPARSAAAHIDLDLFVEEPFASPISSERPPGRPVIGRDGPFNVAVTQDEAGYFMRVRGLADIRFNDALDTAVCTPGPALGSGGFRDLSTTVLSCWMVLRGSAVFHGSAVTQVPGLAPRAAVAFVGQTRSGKSTWAAMLYNAGATVVTDDALPVGSDGGRPVVEGGCEELRLRDFDGSVLAVTREAPRRSTVDGRWAVSAGEHVTYPLPLSSVVVLQRDDGLEQPVIADLAPREAFTKLAAVHRVTGLRTQEAQLAHFDKASDIAQAVPVLLVRAPTSFAPAQSWAESLVGELAARIG